MAVSIADYGENPKPPRIEPEIEVKIETALKAL
jgi:hypothetical protein